MPTPENLEQVLITCQSADPFSTLVVSPQTGAAVWSYKGSELQGAITNLAAPVGVNGDYLAVTTKDKPMLHIVAVHIRDRTHQKSVLPGIARALAVHPSGTVVCCAIDEKIYTWMLTTGQLLTIISAHYQPVSHLQFVSDGSALVSAGDDGIVQIWLLTDLMTPHDAGLMKPEPLRKWSPHSVPVTGLFVTSGGVNCRILSCSSDQTASRADWCSGLHLCSSVSRTRVQFPLRAAPHPTKVLIPPWVGELVAAMLRIYRRQALVTGRPILYQSHQP
uniref:Uncharacterized protein n=1 Tax=Plectus sambesii TaxID=2011161 RepID=A0A914X001_9BILA